MLRVMNIPIKVKERQNVYPPGEDTWFLSDTLIDFCQKCISPSKLSSLVCELGVGTGYISIALSIKFPHFHFIGIDISQTAIFLSSLNMKRYLLDGKYSLLCTNFFDCLNFSTFKPYIIFFNPPYVITSKTEQQVVNPELYRTWSGGSDGIRIIVQFLEELRRIQFNYSFFITSSRNKNDLLIDLFIDDLSLQIISERQLPDEKLLCYQVKKKKGNF